MKKLFLMSLSGILLLTSALSADAYTIIPGGNVAGLWTSAGSPYLIQGNITIPVDSSLFIESAVEVTFLGNYNLLVNGLLKAEGSSPDSIHFGVSSGTWKGIRFTNSAEVNRLAYCSVQGVQFHGAIRCDNSSLVVTHSRISGNQGSGGNVAGGILVVNSNPEISYCDISNNVAYGNGGGIQCSGNSSALIVQCTLNGNVAQNDGGGIYVSGNSNALITGCTVIGNYAGEFGGGVAYDGSDCIISYSNIMSNDANFGAGLWISSDQVALLQIIVWDNMAQGEGGGIWMTGADATIVECTINSNAAFGYVGYPVENGGAIFASDCDSLTLNHSLLLYNHCNSEDAAGGIQLVGNTSFAMTNSVMKGGHNWGLGALISFGGQSSDVAYNDLQSWPGYPAFLGDVPSGLGLNTQINANGDPCDAYYNIALDPLFVNPYGDFHLQPDSPCIDAGDPSSPFDPDSTVTDVGRYYFDQIIPEIEILTTSLDFGIVIIGEAAQLPLMIYNVGRATLQLYAISCSDPVFSTNWSPTQDQILPGDSLQIIVNFAPTETFTHEDTLSIESNGGSCTVLLSGSGTGTLAEEEGSRGDLPTTFALGNPYPNPFNPTTTLQYQLPVACLVQLDVYDVTGNVVAKLTDGWRGAGRYEVTFDASGLAAGIYFAKLLSGNYSKVQKMALLK